MQGPRALTHGFPPGVFLIGAQKAGTTFLAGLLDQHPRIALASPKEPHYFTQHRDRGLQWYRRCFPENVDTRILVDASPSYSAAPRLADARDAEQPSNPYVGVPHRIAQVSPHARFLYVVRDPVARMHSGYWHAVRTGVERRCFHDAIAGDSHYRRASDYLYQLRCYLEHFPRERVLILRFEDLVREPLDTAGRCFDFLGLESVQSLETGTGRNRSHRLRGPARVLDRTLAPFGGLKQAARLGRWLLPQPVRRLAESALTSRIPEMERADRVALLAECLPMAEAFEAETGVKLYPWAAEHERPDDRLRG